ncbi:MAG: hypothetical protein RMM08_08540 [Armatimonadota bacterium]|nr:hypothetical protein [Armatimonadota bacterium]
MQYLEHLLARWVLMVLVFVVAGAMTAPLSALLWRRRRALSLVQLKGALSAVVLTPVVLALFTALVAVMPPCAYHSVCYFGWLQQNLGNTGILLLRALLLATATLLIVFMVRLVVYVTTALSALRQLHKASRAPSGALQQVLQQVVPYREHHRFRELPSLGCIDMVYAGVCFLSEQSVRTLNEVQLRAVVAHEWQHLRSRDGWFAFAMGLLVRSAGLEAWSMALRRWSHAAELLADERATLLGVPRIDLARTLLHQQASAQGLSLGFAANSSLLEERLRLLLAPQASTPGWAWFVWLAIVGGCGLALYVVWAAGGASTCTIHCILF